jgi:hypothetical protein
MTLGIGVLLLKMQMFITGIDHRLFLTKMRHYFNILYICISISILSSCSIEDVLSNKNDASQEGKITLNCTATLPGNNALNTKSLGETATIKSLYLVLFDESGNLVEIDKAYPGTYDVPEDTYTPNENNETVFHVDVQPSSTPRIIHFVANYVVEKANYGAEYDVMNKMYTSGTDDAYWQRITVDGINAQTRFVRIPLIRNFAKITLDNTATDFHITSYFLYNMNNSGSVAAFNINTATDATNRFATFLNDAGVMHSYSEMIAAQYYGCEPGDVEISNPDITKSDIWLSKDTPSYVFENTYKPNSVNYPFMIIKGHKISLDSNGNDTGVDTYYKADFSYTANNVVTHYNILRNYHYKLVITKVDGAGYTTITAAINGLPMNDLLGATTSTDINNIATDTQHLYVNFTDELAVNQNHIFLKYKNEIITTNEDGTTSTGINNNASSTGISTSSDPIVITGLTGGPVINKTVIYDTDDPSTKYRTIEITPNAPTSGRILTQTIIIKNGGNLSRTITLTLRDPLSLSLSCTPTTVTSLTTDINLSLAIPANITRHRFPLDFYIESDKNNIYPNSTDATYAEMPVVVGSTFVTGQTGNSYSFKRTISYEEYEAATANTSGEKIFNCHFLLYKVDNGTTTMYVKPDNYFNNNIQTQEFTVDIP